MAPAKRSAAVQVIGILHLIGGGLGLLGSIHDGISLLITMVNSGAPTPGPGAPAPFDAHQIDAAMTQNVPGYRAFQVGGFLVGLLFDVMLISGGVGLLRQKSWGRTISLIWAPLSIIHKLFAVVYQVVFIIPALRAALLSPEALASIPPQQRPVIQMTVTLTSYLRVVGGVIIVYPIVVLCVLLMPSVAATFKARPAPEDEFEDDHDDRDPPRDLPRPDAERPHRDEGFRGRPEGEY